MTELIELSERDRRRIAAHLLALEPESRWRRFLAGVADTSIQSYVDGLGSPRDVLIGAVDASEGPALIGLAHAGLCLDDDGVITAEIGLSVLAPARGVGLGSQLMRHAMAEAGRLGARRAVLHFSADNRPMQALARGIAGARVTGASVRQAAFDLQPPRPVRSGWRSRLSPEGAGRRC
jgi:GNAT superfamily N-acetyltransferase